MGELGLLLVTTGLFSFVGLLGVWLGRWTMYREVRVRLLELSGPVLERQVLGGIEP